MLTLKIDVSKLSKTWFGYLVYCCISKKKSVVIQNIDRVFSEALTSEERRCLVIAHYSHMIRLVKEVFLIGFLGKKWLERRVEVRGTVHLCAAAQKGKGVILLTGHFGNWEFTPLLGLPTIISDFKGKFHFIRKSLRFSFLDFFLWGRYQKAGINIIKFERALIRTCSALKNNDAVLFAMDQRVRSAFNTGISSLFLGQKATTYDSIARLAEKFKCSVVPATCYRVDDKNHIVEFFEEIPWQDATEYNEAIIKNTLAYNEQLEGILLAHPEQWIWNYKRWA